MITICAMLSDLDRVEDFLEWAGSSSTGSAVFWCSRTAFLPKTDSLLRVFRVLDPKQFEAAFRR